MEKRKEFWRALPFVMALLLLTLVPMQSASALFGKGKEEAKAVDGAPVAENMEIKVYRGVPYEGEFRAVDNEGDEVTFAIAQEPKKGMVALTEDGLLEQALHVKFSDIEQDEGYLPWQNRDFAWQDGRLAIVCNSRSDIQDGEQYPSRYHYSLGCGLSVSVYADDALQYYGIYDSTLDLANGYAADVQPPYQNPISAAWRQE